MQYFYDKQIRRYLMQFVRLFSNFSVQIGEGPSGDPIYRTVPVKYGDPSRMAASIMRENTENKMLSVPMISVYITGLMMAPQRRTDPTHFETVPVVEKKFNTDTMAYENNEGDAFSITRHNPIPYDLQMNVDIWTSNTDQKLQLFEQLLILFNPTLDLKSSDNMYDWSKLSYNELTNVNFSSRQQPVGTEDIIDIGTLTFVSQINLQPPAKFNRTKLIHTIINKLYTMDEDQLDNFKAGTSFTYDSLGYIVVTPSLYRVTFDGTSAQIMNANATTVDGSGATLDWAKILAPYGEINEGYSQIRFRLAGTPDDDDSDVIGTIAYDAVDTTKLTVTLDNDTLPTATETAVLARVNPQSNYPGDGTLAAATTGQRYVLTQSNNSSGWGALVADPGDIVEYDGTNWNVVFDASASSGAKYVTDSGTSELLYYDTDGWRNAVNTKYEPGFWRIFI